MVVGRGRKEEIGPGSRARMIETPAHWAAPGAKGEYGRLERTMHVLPGPHSLGLAPRSSICYVVCLGQLM